MRFNNKNWPLPERTDDWLPFGMHVYDGSVEIMYKVYHTHSAQEYPTLYYAIDNTTNWTQWNWQQDTIFVNDGQTVYFYGPSTNRPCEELNGSEYRNGFGVSSGTGKIDLIGNLLSIINPNWTQDIAAGINCINMRNQGVSKFAGLFVGMKDNLYNAGNMYIRTTSANIGGQYNIGFGAMFAGCTHLLTAPHWICANNTLTCTGIAAFISMFDGCTSLSEAEIPPITGGSTNRTLESLFNGCSSLNKIIYKGTQRLDNSNLSRGVASTGDFYNLNGATYATGSNGIPANWTIHTTL